MNMHIAVAQWGFLWNFNIVTSQDLATMHHVTPLYSNWEHVTPQCEPLTLTHTHIHVRLRVHWVLVSSLNRLLFASLVPSISSAGSQEDWIWAALLQGHPESHSLHSSHWAEQQCVMTPALCQISVVLCKCLAAAGASTSDGSCKIKGGRMRWCIHKWNPTLRSMIVQYRGLAGLA